MSKKALTIALKILFAVVYFLVFLFLIDWIFRNTLSALASIAAVACWVIALIASVGLAHYTVEKNEGYIRKLRKLRQVAPLDA